MKRNRVLAALLVVMLVCSMAFPVLAKADTGRSITSDYRINPLYSDLVMPQLLEASGTLTAAEEYCNTMEEAAAELRGKLEERDLTITVGYATTGTCDIEMAHEIFDIALLHTGVPTQGDYLMRHYRGYHVVSQSYTEGNVTYITFTYNMEYLSSASHEQAMDSAVQSLLTQLNVYNASDYEKVCAVYDYICQNVTYDYFGLAMGDSLVYTAYAALVQKSAVCQGYASLFYRLMLELDVDARVIAGIGNSSRHGWNIVKLSGRYYDVDATWDATICQAGQDYEYFLRCDANFDDHLRDEEYATETFYSQYPMAPEDYDPEQDTGDDSVVARGTCGENLTWTLDKEGTLTISGTGEMNDFGGTVRPWNDFVGLIKRVVIESGVTTIGESAFYSCTYLKSVTIPDSVTSIGEEAFLECIGLQSVTIGSSVKTIGDSAFEGCGLYSVVIPESVTVIGVQAFSRCWCLNSVTIPDNVTYIGESAFSQCDRLIYNLYGNAKYLGNAKNLYAVLISATSTSITYCQINSNTKLIAPYAFWGCINLTDVYYDSSVIDWNKVSIAEYNEELTKANIQYAVNLTNCWYLEDNKWYYYENDTKVTNAWRKDSIGWVYLGADGAMLTNAWCTDSKGWCYVGADGYAVTNCWKKDSIGWIWLDANGSMTKNQWILDGGKWYFLDGNGYMVSNQWRKDSKGWCWLTASGAMATNQWVKDSKGWCYVGSDGYCWTNRWAKDSVGWIWLDKEGSMTKNAWVYDGGYWYWLDGNGYMVSNTSVRISGKVYYFNASGVCTNP